MPRLHLAPALIALTIGANAGCAGSLAPAVGPRVVSSDAVVRVQDRWLLLHLSRSAGPGTGGPLVMYVTGDGGWRGKDLETFHHLRRWGQPVAGFSAPDYLDRLRGGADSLSPHALAADFVTIINVAVERLRLSPPGRVVLVGVSRGADLVVVAAGERRLEPLVEGVVAVALTDEEEYVRRRPRPHFGPRPGAPLHEPRLEMVKPYEYLDRIGSPLSLIQSTNDEYVPAATAGRWFGPDTTLRRFHPIESRNHSFSDARDALYRMMHASIEWVIHASPASIAGRTP